MTDKLLRIVPCKQINSSHGIIQSGPQPPLMESSLPTSASMPTNADESCNVKGIHIQYVNE